jgi:hypothetical protein
MSSRYRKGIKPHRAHDLYIGLVVAPMDHEGKLWQRVGYTNGLYAYRGDEGNQEH